MVRLLEDSYSYFFPVPPQPASSPYIDDRLPRSLADAEVNFRKLENLYFDKNKDIDRCRSLTFECEDDMCLITFDGSVCDEIMKEGSELFTTVKNVSRLLSESGVGSPKWGILEIHVERIDGRFVRGSLPSEIAKREKLYRVERPFLTVELPADTVVETLKQVYHREIDKRKEYCLEHIHRTGNLITGTLDAIDITPEHCVEICEELRAAAEQTILNILGQRSAAMTVINDR